MKLTILFFLFGLVINAASADEFIARVDSIEEGEDNLPHLIKFENGRVVFLDGAEKDQIETFAQSMENGDYLEVVVDKRNSFESAETVEGENEVPPEISPERSLSYEPTVVSSYTEANNIFLRMRRNYQNESQCYNRAHVWAYEEFKRNGLNSIKLFMFFTNRYIRNYRYQWWFHVSPMALVNEGGASVERVLDRRYTSGPRYVNTWTRNFIYSGRTCPVVQRYNDYRYNQEKEDCYLIPVSMYFWQPRDIERRDNTGYEKKSFIKNEVDWAYWEAF